MAMYSGNRHICGARCDEPKNSALGEDMWYRSSYRSNNNYAESLIRSNELAIGFDQFWLYYRRRTRRRKAIRKYFPLGYDILTIMNRQYEVHIARVPLEGYMPLQCCFSRQTFARLMARVRDIGYPAACQWVEEILRSSSGAWVSVRKTEILPLFFDESKSKPENPGS
jgi:hypothetical protein